MCGRGSCSADQKRSPSRRSASTSTGFPLPSSPCNPASGARRRCPDVGLLTLRTRTVQGRSWRLSCRHCSRTTLYRHLPPRSPAAQIATDASQSGKAAFSSDLGRTLIRALLMFIGQLTAVGILLILAGITRLGAYPVQAMARSFNRADRPGK